MRILHHLPLSPYARKVRLVLAEKRLPFQLRLENTWDRRPERVGGRVTIYGGGTRPSFLQLPVIS